MFSLAPFLTQQYMPDPNKAAANAVHASLGREQNDLERQRQKTAHEEFGTEQERLREATGLQTWANVYGIQQNALGPLIQKHAELLGEGTEESLRAARDMEGMMGNLGLTVGPPGGQQGQQGPVAQLPAQELQNQQTARARNQIIYGMSPPAYLPPVGQSYQPQTAPEAPASAAPQPPAKVAPQSKKATAVPVDETPSPTVEPPAEVRQTVQEENARNYGPMFRAAPAYLPSPGTKPESPPVDAKEQKFRNWYAGVAKRLDLDPNPDAPEHQYNYRAAFDAIQRGEFKAPGAPGGHWPSKYKMPGHPREILVAPNGRAFSTVTGKYLDTGERVPDKVMNGPGVVEQGQAQSSRFAAGEKLLEAAPAQAGTIGNTGQQPQAYGLYMNGRHIGDVNPAEIIARTQTEGQRIGKAVAEGTDPQFRPLIEKMFAQAKSKAEVERLMHIFGTPEIQALIHERSSIKSSAATAAARGGRTATLDYLSGMFVEEKSANDNQVKDSIDLYRTVHQARSALRSGNPIATQDAVRMVAKLQNKGVLTDKDADAPRALISQREKLFDWLKGKTVGDLTEETKKMFMDYLEQKEAVLDEQIRGVHDAEIEAQKSHAIPSYEAQEGWKARMHSRYGNMPWYNRKTVDAIGGKARPPPVPKPGPTVSASATGADADKRVTDKLNDLKFPGAK